MEHYKWTRCIVYIMKSTVISTHQNLYPPNLLSQLQELPFHCTEDQALGSFRDTLNSLIQNYTIELSYLIKEDVEGVLLVVKP